MSFVVSSALHAPAPTIAPPKPRRRWPRRLLKFAIFLFGGLALLWTTTFALATIDKNRAARELKKRGHPTTLEEALAMMQAQAGVETSVELVREAIAEDSQLGGPGDAYQLAGGKYDASETAQLRVMLTTSVQKSAPIVGLLEKANCFPPDVLT